MPIVQLATIRMEGSCNLRNQCGVKRGCRCVHRAVGGTEQAVAQQNNTDVNDSAQSQVCAL